MLECLTFLNFGCRFRCVQFSSPSGGAEWTSGPAVLFYAISIDDLFPSNILYIILQNHLNFVHIVKSTFYFVYLSLCFFLLYFQYCNSMCMTCSIKRPLILSYYFIQAWYHNNTTSEYCQCFQFLWHSFMMILSRWACTWLATGCIWLTVDILLCSQGLFHLC